MSNAKFFNLNNLTEDELRSMLDVLYDLAEANETNPEAFPVTVVSGKRDVVLRNSGEVMAFRDGYIMARIGDLSSFYEMFTKEKPINN
jgi:hypothetical protein